MPKLTPYDKLDDLEPLEKLEAIVTHLALTDVTNIVARRIKPCRFCHGNDFLYQWKTKREFQYQRNIWEETRILAACGSIKVSEVEAMIEPSDAGGYGYTPLISPNPVCPECAGLGEIWFEPKDDTKLDPALKMLFNGIKHHKDGTYEILLEKKSTYIKLYMDFMRLRAMAKNVDDERDALKLLEDMASKI